MIRNKIVFTALCPMIKAIRGLLLILIICLDIYPAFADSQDAVLVNQQTDLIVKNGKLLINRSYELMINNRDGEEYAKINIPFSKMNKVSKIEAYIKDKNGVIVKKLRSGDIIEHNSFSDGSFYEDNFVKEFTLIHNVYPYFIYYSYQLQEDAFFLLDDWSPCIFKDIPTLKATLTLEVPTGYKFRYSAHLIDSTKVDTLDARLKYTWKASYSNQIESEIYSPDKWEFVPEVVIVPDRFVYNREGSLSSWKAYGNWESQLLDGLNDLPVNELNQINLLINGVKDDKDKIKILYHYMQDATRYINVSIKTGGMKPYPASYVSINKYGDCKALSNYFKSVLGYIDIPSFYTNIQAGDQIKKIDQAFPSMQFNHVILCIPLSKDTVWLDCTSDGPFGYLGTFTQNRPSFIVDKDNSRFINTPSLSKKEVLDTRTIQINSDTDNEMKAIFHTISRGESFERLSGLTRSASDSRKSQIIRNYLIESGFEMIDFNLIPAHRDSAFITLDYTAKAEKYFKKYGNELLIPLVPFSIPLFKEPKNRKYPVQIDFPINETDTVLYQLPAGYQLSVMPKDQAINTIFGTYTIRFYQKSDKVEVIKNFFLNAGNYPLTRYPDFYKFVKTVMDLENFTYIVTKKQDL